MNNKKENWEKRFDEEFDLNHFIYDGKLEYNLVDAVKSFIRQEIIRAIEGIGLEERELPLFEEFEVKTQEDLLKVGHRGKVIGYNQAIQELEAQKQALIKKLNQ